MGEEKANTFILMNMGLFSKGQCANNEETYA